jgi:O-acetyl-ADP-ribose deacetylase (regulator of RNase III)
MPRAKEHDIRKRFGKTIIELTEGDITELDTDAIVNAANSRLAHGGGVAGAIVRKGGKIIEEESDTWIIARGEVPVGSAAITSGGQLRAGYVIHAVGPIMGEGDEDEKLKNATLASLRMADKHNLKSIAFPAVSTGIFGYPIDQCARVMLSASIEYINGKTGLVHIVFCLFGKKALQVFRKTLKELYP